jgi:hypothetical protein
MFTDVPETYAASHYLVNCVDFYYQSARSHIPLSYPEDGGSRFSEISLSIYQAPKMSYHTNTLWMGAIFSTETSVNVYGTTTLNMGTVYSREIRAISTRLYDVTSLSSTLKLQVPPKRR